MARKMTGEPAQNLEEEVCDLFSYLITLHYDELIGVSPTSIEEHISKLRDEAGLSDTVSCPLIGSHTSSAIVRAADIFLATIEVSRARQAELVGRRVAMIPLLRKMLASENPLGPLFTLDWLGHWAPLSHVYKSSEDYDSATECLRQPPSGEWVEGRFSWMADSIGLVRIFAPWDEHHDGTPIFLARDLPEDLRRKIAITDAQNWSQPTNQPKLTIGSPH